MGSLSGGRRRRWRRRRWWCTTQSKINQSEHEKGARERRRRVRERPPECRQEWSEARRRCSRWKRRTDPPEIAGHKMLPIWRLNLWRVVLLFRLVAAAVVSLSPYIFPLIAGRTGLINGGSGTDVNHGPRPRPPTILPWMDRNGQSEIQSPDRDRAPFGCDARK